MKSEKGMEITKDLEAALLKDRKLLMVFGKMKPSCHIEYSEYIDRAKDAKIKAKRVESIVGRISKWGFRHNLLQK